MEKKDYYLILEVPRDASCEGIRASFRRLAKCHHPDLTGPEETRRFQDILEAYTVLSDPSGRKAYDESLEKSRSGTHHTSSSGKRVKVNRARPRPVRAESFYSESRRSERPFLVEVILSKREAARGGVLPMRLPWPQRCPFCFGSGTRGLWACPRCNGKGTVLQEKMIRVSIPAGIEDEIMLQVVMPERSAIRLPVWIRILVEEGASE